MTLPNSTAKGGPYAGDGVTVLFSVPFYFLQDADLLVTKTSTAGVDSSLVITTNYTVTGAGNPSGGSITTTGTGSPIASGEKITITRNVPLTQGVQLPSTGALPSASMETEYDKLTMIDQQQQLQLDRSVKIPVSANYSPPAMGDFSAADGKAPQYQLSTNSFIPGASSSDISNAAANAAIATAAAAAASASAAAVNFRFMGVAGGTANSLTFTPSPVLASYTGAFLSGIIGATGNSTAPNINVSGLGAKNVKKFVRNTKVDCAPLDLQANSLCFFAYDATDLILLNPPWDDASAASVASASTINLNTPTGNFALCSGTTGITAITLAQGRRFVLRHTGVQTITNSGTLVLLGGANITTAVGDISEWYNDGTNTYLIRYEKVDGTPLVGAGGKTLLATVNASGAASVAFDSTKITNTYNKYEVEFDGVFGSGAAADLLNTLSTNNGGGYLSASYASVGIHSDGTTVATQSTTSSFNITTGTTGIAGTTLATGSSGTIKYGNPAAAAPLMATWHMTGNNNASANILAIGSGQGPGTTAINNIKFALSAGNITGNFHLYGIQGV